MCKDKIIAVGSMRVPKNGKHREAFIFNRIVLKEEENKGYGTLLASERIEAARRMGCESVAGNAYIDNPKAIKSLFKAGFQLDSYAGLPSRQYGFHKSLIPSPFDECALPSTEELKKIPIDKIKKTGKLKIWHWYHSRIENLFQNSFIKVL